MTGSVETPGRALGAAIDRLYDENELLAGEVLRLRRDVDLLRLGLQSALVRIAELGERLDPPAPVVPSVDREDLGHPRIAAALPLLELAS